MNPDLPNPALIELERKLEKLTWVFVVLAGANLFFLGCACLQVAVMIPKFDRIFAEMLGDAPLPVMTGVVIGASRFGAGMALPVLTLLVPLASFTNLVFRRKQPFAWAVTVATLVLQMLWMVFAVISLYFPILSITAQMNGG